MRRRRPDRHERFLELASMRLLEPLSRSDAAALDGHLATCDRCALVETEFRRESRALRALPALEPPRDLWARTATALDHEVGRGLRPWQRPPGAAEPERHGVSAGAGLAALLVLVVAGGLVAGQLLPGALISSTGRGVVRPTPFAVPPQELALVGADPEGLAIYRASVDRVCPQPVEDCTNVVADRQIVHASILRSPSAVAVGPDGQRIAITGQDEDGGVVYAVVELRPLVRTGEERPGEASAPPTDPPSEAASAIPTAGEPVVTSEPSAGPAESVPPVSAEPSLSAVPTVLAPEGPAQDDLRAILRGVLAAGAPPAWSADSRTLAFSATPDDGSTGPDIYLWHPGDAEARPLTSDHRSSFASWAGSRIVISRTAGSADPLAAPRAETIVLDPVTGEERAVEGLDVWLPNVDPTGRWVVAWRGPLASDGMGGLRPVTGVLVRTAWRLLDPFADRPVDAQRAIVGGEVVGRGSVSSPLRDWELRWADDGRAFGLWVADREGAGTGTLTILATAPQGETSQVVLGPLSSRRGFSIGLDRVAWVAPGSAGQGGDLLQVGTWGETGAGALRVKVVGATPAVPGF